MSGRNITRSRRLGPDVRHALYISVASLAWTILVGFSACAAGVTTGSLALLAFGAIGLLDAAGSATLVIHFRHSLRHQAVSERLERVALRIVTMGMFLIGLATVAVSLYRLGTLARSGSSAAGIVLAAASFVGLALLAGVKRRLANKIGSQALFADGSVSALGALLALVTLLGAGLTTAYRWAWVDPAAASAIASAAIVVSFVLRGGSREP